MNLGAPRFRELLQRLAENRLDRASERQLFLAHTVYFRRRVSRLGVHYFPGSEKSVDAVRSMANGAFASFLQEPYGGGAPAFQQAITDHPGKELKFLYTWPRSAAMAFVRREASPILNELCKLRRNVRLHLAAEEFVTVHHRGAEPRYGLSDWGRHTVRARPEDLTQIQVHRRLLRGRNGVRKILEAAGSPLTLSEVVAVWARLLGLATSEWAHPASVEELAGELQTDRPLEVGDVRERVRAFWNRLTPDDRALLKVRYGVEGKAPRSFRQVSQELGRYCHERYRQFHEVIQTRIRESFPEDRFEDVAEALMALIAEEPLPPAPARLRSNADTNVRPLTVPAVAPLPDHSLPPSFRLAV